MVVFVYATSFCENLQTSDVRGRFVFKKFEYQLSFFLWVGGGVLGCSLVSPSRQMFE